MNTPLVSVIIPCYNADLHVERAIRSIMEQSYQNLQIIVVNDCSTDGTKSILVKLSQEDSRICYLENEVNRKLIFTLNRGLSVASGDYIARMDADDISFATRIEEQVRFLEDHSDYGVVGSSAIYIDKDGLEKGVFKTFSHNDVIKSRLYIDSPFIHPSVLIRKTIISTYDHRFLQTEDYGLWVTLSKKTNFYNIPKPLLYYRVLEESETRLSQRDKTNRHVVLKEIYKHLFTVNNHVDISDTELDQYTFSMYRPNFSSIDPLQLRQVYQKILKKNPSKTLEEQLTERWIGTGLLGGDRSIRSIFVYLTSKYTYLGLFLLIYRRITHDNR